MDIVLQSQFEQFKKQFDISSMTESDAFELFVIYCVASKYVKYETITKDLLVDLNVGNGGDWGIDGLIVIVNGRIVKSIEMLNDLYQANPQLSIHFIFIQAKTSESFSSAFLGQTLDGVENFLRDLNGAKVLPPCNAEIADYRDMFRDIYTKSADFKDGKNPDITVYYAACGEYRKQEDFSSKIEATKDFVDKTNFVEQFNCLVVGKRELIDMYKATKSQLTKDIKIEHKLSMPDVDKITESYLCLIPFSEFRKLIIDEQGDIIESVFYDNVRAFQGLNSVNNSMAQSLKDGDIELFTAMNNGITIIAKNLQATGNNIHLVDYQIVNGCQTCNVLQRCKDVPNIDELRLTVKIISSQDKEISKKIIVGNNSQTEVKREQLISLLDTQKYIEEYYNAQNKFEKLYYERRSKQYRNSGANIPIGKVVTISFQILAYISMIMGKPEKVRGYYGSIVEQFEKEGQKVFSPDINPALYYTCALASHKMADLFARSIIDRKYKKVKFHLLYAFRLMCECGPLSKQVGHAKIEAYCDHLCTILCDEQKCKDGFLAAQELIRQALEKKEPKDSDSANKEFTKRLNLLINEAVKRKNELRQQ